MKHILTNTPKSLENWLSTFREFQLDDLFTTEVLARAFAYVDDLTMDHTAPMLLKATVAGKYSSYLVAEHGAIYGECSCLYDRPCKHLAALILKSINR